VGTCQVSYDKADQVIEEIVVAIREANARENMGEAEMSDLLSEVDDLFSDLDLDLD
jgi:hypothetical protein